MGETIEAILKAGKIPDKTKMEDTRVVKETGRKVSPSHDEQTTQVNLKEVLRDKRRGRRLSMEGQDLYTILDLPKDCSEDEIKSKYRNLARMVHPDNHPNDKEEAEIQFQRLKMAHDILGDKNRRKVYDKYGSAGIWVCEKYGYKVAQSWYKGLLWTAALCVAWYISPTTCGFCCLCCLGCCHPCQEYDDFIFRMKCDYRMSEEYGSPKRNSF